MFMLLSTRKKLPSSQIMMGRNYQIITHKILSFKLFTHLWFLTVSIDYIGVGVRVCACQWLKFIKGHYSCAPSVEPSQTSALLDLNNTNSTSSSPSPTPPAAKCYNVKDLVLQTHKKSSFSFSILEKGWQSRSGRRVGRCDPIPSF